MQESASARVTGIGARTSLGEDVAAFGKALREGRSGIRRSEGRVPAVAGWMTDYDFDRALAGASFPEAWAAKARRVARRSPLSVQCSVLAGLEAWGSAGFFEDPPEREERVGIVVAGQNISAGYQFVMAGRFRAEPEYLP